MILHHVEVLQTIDRDQRGRFIKELVVTRGPAGVPLAMVRKRSAEAVRERGAEASSTLAPVLLIHGFGQNRYAFHLPSRSLSNFLARAGFDVYNLDLRGHGRSRNLGAKRPSHVADFVREDIPAAIEEVQRHSGKRGVFLVGHSLGGLVSYAAAGQLAGAIGGVVSIGSPYHFTRGSLPLRLLGEVMLGLDRRVPLGHGSLGLKACGEAIRLSRGFIESPFFPLPIRGFVPGSMEPAILAQHMSLAMDNGSIAVLRNMFLDAAEARRNGHRLGGLTGFAQDFEAQEAPLLIIAGERDDLAPPVSVEPAFVRSRARDKTYRIFPRGHIDLLIGREAPGTVWALLEEWLRLRASGSATLAP